MTHLRKLALILAAILGLATATPAMADAGPGRCTGSFVNPITDICWSCLFPISIGGLDIWPSSRPDPDNPDLPVCLCGLRPGIAMGFWEPVRLADVSMKPWCFVNLGGMKLDPGFDIGFRSISGPSAVGGASQYYSSWHVHWYPTSGSRSKHIAYHAISSRPSLRKWLASRVQRSPAWKPAMAEPSIALPG